MSKLLGFVRTTLVGGLLYLVPIIVLLAILGKAVQIAHGISPPVLELVRTANLGGILTPQVVAILLLVLFCFAAGLFASTAVAKRIRQVLEAKVLSNLPGYEFIKGVSESLAGVDTSGVRDAVMVRIEDAWQIAFVVDHLDDGHLAVYVPGVPDSRSGSLYFMTAERVKPLKIPMTAALQTLRRMGVGSKELLRGGIETQV
ncbi:MAG TPA: DUF502 domain-containing protein [Woeseiaceae bacterium]|nr:DUF502 domain-containing protein [Woeseiaceae bacterium]